MTYLTDRHEIAKAMNFGKYPVVHINMETPKDGYEGYFVGDKVKVMAPNGRYTDAYATGDLYYCDGEYGVNTDACGLHAGFGYYDVMESMKIAQAPVFHAGEQVVVIEDYPKAARCCVHLMKVSDRVDAHVYPCCTLKEV